MNFYKCPWPFLILFLVTLLFVNIFNLYSCPVNFLPFYTLINSCKKIPFIIFGFKKVNLFQSLSGVWEASFKQDTSQKTQTECAIRTWKRVKRIENISYFKQTFFLASIRNKKHFSFKTFLRLELCRYIFECI